MLICSISQRARRTAIAADLVETAIALDANTTGNIIFATLVDDPASVGETVDAYLGETMLEVASASDSLGTGLAYVAGIDEVVTAADVLDATMGTAIAARQAMIAGAAPVLVNSGTVPRQANANGVMVNVR